MKLSTKNRTLLIICLTILAALIIFGFFRVLILGIVTWDNLIEAIKLFIDGNEEAMIGML